MIDYLGNHVGVGDTVIIPIRQGNTASLSRAFVQDTKMKPQYAGGALVPHVFVEWSNLHRYWMPAKRVVKIPDDLLPEKLKEKLYAAEEAVVVT